MNPNIRDSCKLHLVLVFVLRESAERQRGSSVLLSSLRETPWAMMYSCISPPLYVPYVRGGSIL